MASKIALRFQQIHLERGDSAGDVVARGVAARDFERAGGDVRRHNFSLRQLARQRHGDASRAGADVGDAQRGVAALRAQALKRGFDQVLGFRARDQDAGIHLEREAPELLHAGQVLHGDAGGAAIEQFVQFQDVGGGQQVLGVRVKPGAVAPEDVKQEQLRGERRRSHAGGFEVGNGLRERVPRVDPSSAAGSSFSQDYASTSSCLSRSAS
jgi:hypothetical protein